MKSGTAGSKLACAISSAETLTPTHLNKVLAYMQQSSFSLSTL